MARFVHSTGMVNGGFISGFERPEKGAFNGCVAGREPNKGAFFGGLKQKIKTTKCCLNFNAGANRSRQQIPKVHRLDFKIGCHRKEPFRREGALSPGPGLHHVGMPKEQVPHRHQQGLPQRQVLRRGKKNQGQKLSGRLRNKERQSKGKAEKEDKEEDD